MELFCMLFEICLYNLTTTKQHSDFFMRFLHLGAFQTRSGQHERGAADPQLFLQSIIKLAIVQVPRGPRSLLGAVMKVTSERKSSAPVAHRVSKRAFTPVIQGSSTCPRLCASQVNESMHPIAFWLGVMHRPACIKRRYLRTLCSSALELSSSARALPLPALR